METNPSLPKSSPGLSLLLPGEGLHPPRARGGERLQDLVRGICSRSHAEVERRSSTTGKYLCLTLIFVAEDEAHLTRINKASAPTRAWCCRL